MAEKYNSLVIAVLWFTMFLVIHNSSVKLTVTYDLTLVCRLKIMHKYKMQQKL